MVAFSGLAYQSINVTDFIPIAKEIERTYQHKHYIDNKDFEVLKKHKYFTDPPSYADDLPGEAKLRQFEHILNAFSYQRHVFQLEFHAIITQALAEYIVGEDQWAIHGARIMEKRGWKKIGKCAMGMAPRRFGKSVSIAEIAIALAIVKEGSIQSIFSTGRRASANLLDLCKKFGIEMDVDIDKDNQEQFFIKFPNGKISKIYSYPANAKV